MENTFTMPNLEELAKEILEMPKLKWETDAPTMSFAIIEEAVNQAWIKRASKKPLTMGEAALIAELDGEFGRENECGRSLKKGIFCLDFWKFLNAATEFENESHTAEEWAIKKWEIEELTPQSIEAARRDLEQESEYWRKFRKAAASVHLPNICELQERYKSALQQPRPDPNATFKTPDLKGGTKTVSAVNLLNSAMANLTSIFTEEEEVMKDANHFWMAAIAFGYDVPDKFHFSAGELFYYNGVLEEVRLDGAFECDVYASGEPILFRWHTPVLPKSHLACFYRFDKENRNLIAPGFGPVNVGSLPKRPGDPLLIPDGSDRGRSCILGSICQAFENKNERLRFQRDPLTQEVKQELPEEARISGLVVYHGLESLEPVGDLGITPVRCGLPTSVLSKPLSPSTVDTKSAPDFYIHTAQEFDALERAACEGKRGMNYHDDHQAGTRTHTGSASHSVRLALSDEERGGGLGMTDLERLTGAQDADCAFALLYVSRALLPRAPGPMPADSYAGGWIVLDDVIKKIGWTPRSTQERQAMRRRVWDYLLFGARASVIGQRTGTYRDSLTGEVINTRIDSPLWSFLRRERTLPDADGKDTEPRPEHPTLFPTLEPPLRVEIVVNRDWTHLCQLSALAQYLPMGELLGAIAPDKPSGAWARVLGLALASFWRREPYAALDGHIKPTRRELLDHYSAKVSPCDELLESNDPRRAVKYWGQSLDILVESGFLEKSGEASRTVPEMLKSLPRQGWQEDWLNGVVELRPGPKLRPAVQERADALPAPKPRALHGPKVRRKSASKKPPEESL